METRQLMAQKPRIFIIEDEAITSYHVQRSLIRLGYEVVGIAADAVSALDQLERTNPDLLLADIGLEGEIDGVEVAAVARQRYGIPVVFLTAYSDAETTRRARTSEPYGYLVKPFAEQELRATIEIALQQNALRTAQEQKISANARILLRTREELRTVTERLLEIQEQERESIARDLHDDIGQRLAVLQMSLENLWAGFPAPVQDATCSEHAKIIRLLEDLSNNLRDISHRLHPSALEHLGLATALQALAETFQESSGLPTQFSARGVPDNLNPKISLALYRIVQEALHNIAKHAGQEATVTVALVGSTEALHLSVRDTGRGIDPKRLEGANGLGLISMAQRAEMVGGNLVIDSHPGQGTLIHVSVPLKPVSSNAKYADSGRTALSRIGDATSETQNARTPGGCA
ncbi:MAG TPA: response regulator [Bryobacteraceae bacterium]|jgi:signal transduction histidine kinase|nr:response regulator [Bryobacteraceae bacterium]